MLMNSPEGAAVLRYEPAGFSVMKRGSFVLCAVSGERIPLDALRYWSASRQEAYATPEIATKRLLGQ
jgi:hypothetical protein